jgi:hypothetical protein
MRIRIALASLAMATVTGIAAVAGNGHDANAAQLLHGWNNVSYLGSSAAPSEALSGIAGHTRQSTDGTVAQTTSCTPPASPPT